VFHSGGGNLNAINAVALLHSVPDRAARPG
jgi:hypothetical protein